MNESRARSSIAARDLHKRYGERVVLKGFRFDAGPGEMHVICGANGSGKTSLLKVLATLLEPEQGSLAICGVEREHGDTALRARLSTYFFSNRGLWPQLSILENWRLHADLFGTELDFWRERYNLLEPMVTGLSSLLPHQLSLGMRQLALISRALLRPGPVYLLDEPFAVLDDANSAKLAQALSSIAAAGATVIVTAQDHLRDRLDSQYLVTTLGAET